MGFADLNVEVREGEDALVSLSTYDRITYPFSLVLTSIPETATELTDYLRTVDVLQFYKGILAMTVSVSTVDDNIVELDETFALSIVGNGLDTSIILEPTLMRVTIRDNDVPEWSVTATPAEISEAAGGWEMTVSTGEVVWESDQTIVLEYADAATAGSAHPYLATPGEDFRIEDSTGTRVRGTDELILPAGETSVTYTFRAVNDREDESAESVLVRASHAGAPVGERQLFTILDNEGRLEPGQPTLDTGEGDGEVILHWRPPSDGGNARITGLRVPAGVSGRREAGERGEEVEWDPGRGQREALHGAGSDQRRVARVRAAGGERVRSRRQGRFHGGAVCGGARGAG